MDSQRWELIQDLFHQALACDESVRAEFILERCQDDQKLLEEIQSLLSCHEAPQQLWEHDRLLLGLKVLAMHDQLPSDKDFGNYTLKRIIGRGGMGDVYLGRDKRLGRHVALKFLPASLSSNVELSLRFHEEARAASSIAHANIAHIYELGNVEDRQYIAMEFIDGVTLRERLKRGPVELVEAIAIAEQVGRGIAAAHAAGVLHRDIKPENIMLGADGFVKVLDFGLAKTSRKAALDNYHQSLETGLTSPGVIMGTAAYMSPEQFCGEETDFRTDIWSLGVTLYELMSGHHPFQGKNYNELRTAVLMDEPMLPVVFATLAPDHPAKTLVYGILNRALQKRKEDRYVSIEAFVNDLRRVRLLLDQASSSWMDHATGPQFYPNTPAFQQTSELVTSTRTHAPKKDHVLRFSIFLLMSLGFFGVLLGAQQVGYAIQRSFDLGSHVSSLMTGLSYAANLLGGFAVGRMGILLKTSWRIRYPFVVLTIVLGYLFFFATFHWMPSIAVFVIYSLPYFAVALVGAALAFRPWSLVSRFRRR